ncbi:sensor histidine kinase [Paenibacillus paeoniae]|uniref:histidine kinase n=1 Tax=Paenibacillus paeoniae TaxID=2292705 RepID=A0A371PKC1_9BACL|nr:sensor histidine kinase [Paenibacillus paeoniae]REK76656.1 sensor histidine kinase [Paenibacillus paeoniae]
MRSYWIWLAMLLAAWGLAMFEHGEPQQGMSWRLLVCALGMSAYFLVPIARRMPAAQLLLLALLAVAATASLWPEPGGEPNPYTLLLLAIIAGKGAYRLPLAGASVIGMMTWIGALMPSFYGLPGFSVYYISLFGLAAGVAFCAFRLTYMNEQHEIARGEALLTEYRKLRRLLATNEKAAREEERAQVGRDIHDSVGHKLTALLMQLEVFRMGARDSETAEKLSHLKELAKESLDDTRSAVKALKDSETGGLSAVINLIRRLEVESYLRVNFNLRHGALTVPLTPAQSVALYRAVQESLTNMMRHSGAKEADIVFEAPGGGVFRFEVLHPIQEARPYREGFGLRSMRERMEEAGGKLDIIQNEKTFIVSGTLPLMTKERGMA